MSLSARPVPLRADGRGILFTAFEPSGDDHAAAVIAELRARHPGLPIYAWGGPKMERAGAAIIQRTGENAVMGLPGLGKILEHRRINRRVGAWLAQRLAAIHVAVDSPAANFPLCALSKRAGLKVVHLVAPQVWAWGAWRVNKLRRLTDLVLCLLPFEEPWFLQRSVPAKFVGHPLFDNPLDEAALAQRLARVIPPAAMTPDTPPRAPRLGLFPGSRPAELSACFPILLDAFRRLTRDFPGATGVVAATRPAVADQLRERARELGGWPDGLFCVAGDADAVTAWCDFALVVSGTMTLQIARQRKPMVAVYRPSWLLYHSLIRWLIITEHYTLPNLIAGKRVIPELIPHFADGEALAVEIIKLMRKREYADRQRADLAEICDRFRGTHAASDAADQIERLAGLGSPRQFTSPARPPSLNPASA